MALGFGRKKSTPEAQDTPAPNAAPSNAAGAPANSGGSPSPDEDDNLGGFDLDAFADELESGKKPGQSSPFDEMFATPASNTGNGGGSAYDFPETDDEPQLLQTNANQTEPLDLNAMFEAEQRDAIAAGKIPPPNAPIPLNTNLGEVAAEPSGLFEPQSAPAKKKLPLVPIIGALVVLGLAGGAFTYFTGYATEEDADIAPASEIRPRPEPPRPSVPSNPPAPPASQVAPPAPANPAPSSGNAGLPLTPALRKQLKALWDQGAAAKHRGDNAGARAAWQKALEVRPGHPGFAEAIAKLPK